MHRRALIRLRIGFLLLAAALLVPLGVLARSMHRKLEAQNRLRHEIVAERVFDEMERELTQLLEREAERPSEAYEAQSTLVSNWAPFVVGYYTRDANGTHVVAESQLIRDRAQRLRAAVSGLPAIRPAPGAPEAVSAARSLPEGKTSAVQGSSRAAPEQVLKQLNRSAGERERAYKRKSSALRLDEPNDPLSGLD